MKNSRSLLNAVFMFAPVVSGISQKIIPMGLFDGGPFDKVLEKITELARDAWGFGVGVLIILAMLVGLYYVIQGVGGSASGSGGMTAKAIIGIVGIVVAVLIAFLLLPELGKMLQENKPEAPF